MCSDSPGLLQQTHLFLNFISRNILHKTVNTATYMKIQKDNLGLDHLKNQTSHKKKIQNKDITLFINRIDIHTFYDELYSFYFNGKNAY